MLVALIIRSYYNTVSNSECRFNEIQQDDDDDDDDDDE